MPCPESNPCNETRRAFIALHQADTGALHRALQSDGWHVTLRTKGAGLFFTRLGLTGTFEPGRDVHLMGMRLEHRKEIQRMAFLYGCQAMELAATEAGWTIRDQMAQTSSTFFYLEKEGLGGKDTILVIVFHDGQMQMQSPPIADENHAHAETLLARLGDLCGGQVETQQTAALEEETETEYDRAYHAVTA